MVKVKDGQIELFNVPENYTNEDGSTTSGYSLLSTQELKERGWVDLIDIQPEYNQETHHLEHGGYEINTDSVTVKYNIVENIIIPVVPPEPSLEELNRADIDYLLMLNSEV